jgi:poly(beta-D-mannuronate) lyase
VIGEGHRVWNNYFCGLTGTGARAALSIHNGIPNSPVGLYHQVKDLEVIHNTFVSNYQTVLVGYAKGKHGAILPPEGTVFANNIIRGKKSPLIQLDEDQARIKYEGNIVYGVKTEVSSRGGLLVVDPKLMKDQSGIYRPQRDSPAKGAAKGSYPKITHDMDGQKRSSQSDVGADQISAKPIIHKPLSRKDVGPVWKR